MSCLENDTIWEAACDKAEAEGVDITALCEMHIEDVHHYLKTGQLTDDYQSILYRLYKS
jgi:hypothetical protein